MSILSQLADIAKEFDLAAGVDTDPSAAIFATGTTADGHTADFHIYLAENGLEVWPGFYFRPYHGIWCNPLLVSITADED
jgi:hypothetical protein